MADEGLGRGKRVGVKTAGYINFKDACNKTKQTSETIQRTKRVRAEAAALDQAGDAEAEVNSQSKKRKPTDEKSKGKAKEPPAASADDDENLDKEEEERRNTVELRKYEDEVNKLKWMIHGRKRTPLDELETLDLDELQAIWEEVREEVEPATPPKASKQPAKKNTAASSTLLAKTPKKLSASKVHSSKVTMISSPLITFQQAQTQSARAAELSPVPKKRPREQSTDRDEKVQRLRVGLTQHLQPQNALLAATQRSGPIKSSSSTRAGSLAPTVASARSGSLVPQPVDSHGYEEWDDEVEAFAPAVKKKSGENEPKPRPKKSDYSNSIEGMLIESAVGFAWARLILNGCPEPDDYDLMLLESWEDALEFCKKSPEDWPLTKRINSVMRGAISSLRSRGRKRLVEAIQSHFSLEVSPTNSLEDIKACAGELIPTEFHRDPTAKGKKAGLYRSPFVARAIGSYWFTGSNAPGIRYPETLNPVPATAMAFICGLSEDILLCFARDGMIKTEVKAKKGEGQGRKKTGEKSKGPPRAKLDTVKSRMDGHALLIKKFQEKLPGVYDKYQYSLRTDAMKWAGKAVPKEEEEEEGGELAGTVADDAFDDEVDISPEEAAAWRNSETAKVRQPPEPKRHLKPAPKPISRRPPLRVVEEEEGEEGEEEEEEEDDGSASESTPKPAPHRTPSKVVEREKTDDEEDDGVGRDDGKKGGDHSPESIPKPARRRAPWRIEEEEDEEEECGGIRGNSPKPKLVNPDTRKPLDSDLEGDKAEGDEDGAAAEKVAEQGNDISVSSSPLTEPAGTPAKAGGMLAGDRRSEEGKEEGESDEEGDDQGDPLPKSGTSKVVLAPDHKNATGKEESTPQASSTEPCLPVRKETRSSKSDSDEARMQNILAARQAENEVKAARAIELKQSEKEASKKADAEWKKLQKAAQATQDAQADTEGVESAKSNTKAGNTKAGRGKGRRRKAY